MKRAAVRALAWGNIKLNELKKIPRAPDGAGVDRSSIMVAFAAPGIATSRSRVSLRRGRLMPGAHRSVAEAAITAYIKIRNAAPKPFRWTKSADDILASIERFCRRTLDTHVKCA